MTSRHFTITFFLLLALPAQPSDLPDSLPKTIVFMGDSITAGYGGVGQERAFPALIQARIDSLGWLFDVVNAGLSGETTAGGLRRINWLLKRQIDILVLALGANDGLRGIPPENTSENLQSIIDRARESNLNVRIVIAGMQMPPNLGPEYVQSFRSIYPSLAKKNNTRLVPFLLEGVAGIPELNLADAKHPNAAGHRIIAETVWQTIGPLLKEFQPDLPK